MVSVNTKLLPLKLVFFFLYGALGCVVAFITNHMYHLGLSHEEVTLINAILPLTALAGPPAIGYLADRFGHYKFITISSMILTAIFHTCLLFVPQHTVTPPPFNLVCDSEGATMVLNTCTNQCPTLPDLHEGTFRLSRCRQICDVRENSCSNLMHSRRNASSGWFPPDELDSIALIEKPLVCFHGFSDGRETSQCNHFPSSTYIDVSRAFNESSLQQPPDLFYDHEECCEYPVGSFSTSSRNFARMTCQTFSNCHVVCDIQELGNVTALQKPECTEGDVNPRTTFWLYFFLRAVAEMLIAVMIALLDAVILTMVAQHGGDYGRQKMFGLFAIGISSPVVGYLMDKKVLTAGKYIYAPVFFTFDILMCCTAFITFLLPFKVDVQRTSLLKNLSSLIRTAELNILFLIVVTLGTFWGFLETFLFPHMLTNLHSSQLIIGLTVSAGVVPSLPFLYKSETIVRICGHHYLLILAFVGYCIRFAGLSYVINPYWVILIEVLKIISLNIMQVASATLAYKLAPKTLVATAQGIVWMAHFNVGRTVGTLVGGYLIKIYSEALVFSGGSVLSAICAIIYLTLYQVAKYIKEKKSRDSQGSQTKSNGAVPNGLYMPLQTTQEKCLE